MNAEALSAILTILQELSALAPDETQKRLTGPLFTLRQQILHEQYYDNLQRGGGNFSRANP